MEFGLHFGTRGCFAQRQNVMTLAQRAEALGYSVIGVADHVIAPASTDERYPYTADGIWPGAPTGECYDVIAALAFLAGCTERIKLLTSVAVVPHRPAVLAAKQLMTADLLSNGRVIAGVGAGWMREEFVALGTPPFDERGAVTDEYLRAWKTLWTEPRPIMEGKYARFANVIFAPKPVSKPHPPIWVGGESPAALRRTVRFGDAWYPVSDNTRRPLNTPAKLADGLSRLHQAAEKEKRDPSSIDVAYLWFRPLDATPKAGADGGRQLFTGSRADMLEDVAALAKAGAKHVVLYLQRPTLQETLDAMQRFAEEVIRNS